MEHRSWLLVPIRHDGWVAQLQDVVFDCRHPASVARFWAAALDGYQVAPYDDAELARLWANGIDGPEEVLAEHERFVTLADPQGNEFCVLR